MPCRLIITSSASCTATHARCLQLLASSVLAATTPKQSTRSVPQVTDVVSAHFEGLTNQAVLENVVARLQEIYPQANTTSKLVGSVVPRWYTNELFGGSYTNWPVRLTQRLLWFALVTYLQTRCLPSPPKQAMHS
jgi:hypothetical protein